MPDYRALNTQVRKHKSALTRAKKKGPEDVLRAVAEAYEFFNSPEGLYPDSWHLWEMAKNDAEYEIRRANWRPKTYDD